MKTLDDILSKLRKLKALSQSSNVHEASLAAGMAVKIMQEYKIEEAQVSLGEEESKSREQVGEYRLEENESEIINFAKKKNHWKMLIASGCAAACHCSTFWLGADIRFIGRKSDVDSARYLFALISPQVERLAESCYNREFILSRFLDDDDEEGRIAPSFDGYGGTAPDRRSWTHAFKIGCARTIRSRMIEQVRESYRDLQRRKELSDNNAHNALMVIDNRLDRVREFEKLLGLRKGKGPTVRNSEAYFKGREKGKEVQLGSRARGALGEGKREIERR